ncbi:hypothetical protein PENSPDRAFT_208211 [Peniophora sp. CONT]|nr:hypothetical protein PENSPDRAFT_208211 [Peniophora sp. CONT]
MHRRSAVIGRNNNNFGRWCLQLIHIPAPLTQSCFDTRCEPHSDSVDKTQSGCRGDRERSAQLRGGSAILFALVPIFIPSSSLSISQYFLCAPMYTKHWNINYRALRLLLMCASVLVDTAAVARGRM